MRPPATRITYILRVIQASRMFLFDQVFVHMSRMLIIALAPKQLVPIEPLITPCGRINFLFISYHLPTLTYCLQLCIFAESLNFIKGIISRTT